MPPFVSYGPMAHSPPDRPQPPHSPHILTPHHLYTPSAYSNQFGNVVCAVSPVSRSMHVIHFFPLSAPSAPERQKKVIWWGGGL